MDGDRIEIELVPTDGGAPRPSSPSAASSRSARAWSSPSQPPDPADGIEAETPDGEAPTSDPNGQRRTVAIAAGVGLVALLLGWAVGRSGRADDAATAPAPTTATTAPPTTEPEPSETIAPLDEPRTTVSWPPVARQQNATDLVANGAAITATEVDVDERLAGQQLVLVGLVGSDLAELDLGASTVTEYVLDGLPRSYGPTIVAGDDWIVVPMYNGQEPFVVRDDGTVGRADLMPDGNQMMHVSGTDRFWRMPGFWGDSGIELEEVDLTGEPTGHTIQLPVNSWPAFADPLGGVVVQVSGRWFSVDAEGSSPIGTGEIVALDDRHVLLYDCVELDDCAIWRVRRDTGAATETPFDLDRLDARFLPASWWNGDPGAGLSPDGRRYATTIESNSSAQSVVIDLMTGSMIELDGVRPGPPTMVWTDDSRFLLYLGFGGEPMAYSVEAGESFPIVVDESVDGWNVIASRP